LIPEIAGYITRREGKKFLRLKDHFNDSEISRSALNPQEELSLYIHIPFCKKLCPFCCFNRYLFHEDAARQYYVSLKKELDLYLERGFSFSHFYFGGGTPTVLMDELLAFIEYLHSKFQVKEISLETTPAELNMETVHELREAGIKRLSLGVQSFDDNMLRAMGRLLCTGEEARRKILMAEGKFETVNIDLIFNFPFQNLQAFSADVRTFKDLGIDQVTFYPLMPSPHKKDAMERKFARVDNRMERAYYEIILREIYDQGFRPSTAWCFSRGAREKAMIDEYIVDYADYAGIGAGSVSLINGHFLVNAFSLAGYNEALSKNRLPTIRRRDLSEKEYLRYYLLTKLFGLRVDKEQFRSHFKAEIREKLATELLLLRLAGAVSENDKEIRITRRGMYTVSVMMREFFASLNTLREIYIEKQI